MLRQWRWGLSLPPTQRQLWLREDSDPDGRAGAQGAQGESRARHGVGAFDGGVRGRRTPPWRRRLSSLLPAGFVAEDLWCWFWCKTASSYGPLRGSSGCPPFGASASSTLSLLAVPSNFMPGVSTLPPSHCEVPSPCTVLVGGSWEPGCAFRWLCQHRRGVAVFGEPGFAPLPPPLVPFSLA